MAKSDTDIDHIKLTQSLVTNLEVLKEDMDIFKENDNEKTKLLERLLVNFENLEKEQMRHRSDMTLAISSSNLKLAEILIQTTKTNGRVVATEITSKENKEYIEKVEKNLVPVLKWKDRLTGVWVTIGVIAGIVLGAGTLVIGALEIIDRTLK